MATGRRSVADLGLFLAGIPRFLIITMLRMVAPALVSPKNKHKLCKTTTTVSKIKLEFGVWGVGRSFCEGKPRNNRQLAYCQRGGFDFYLALPRDSRDLSLLFPSGLVYSREGLGRLDWLFSSPFFSIAALNLYNQPRCMVLTASSFHTLSILVVCLASEWYSLLLCPYHEAKSMRIPRAYLA